MSSAYVLVGDILEFKNIKWRVLENINGIYTFIELNTNKLNVCSFLSEDIKKASESGDLHLSSMESNMLIDINTLSEPSKEILNNAMTIINELLSRTTTLSWFSGTEKGKVIMELSEKYNMSRTTIYKYLRLFLQGGLRKEALIAHYNNCGAKGNKRNYVNKKPGAKGFGSQLPITAEVEKQFEAMYRRYKMGNGKKTYKSLYEELVTIYYSDFVMTGDDTQKIIPYALTEIPSERQFNYWLSNQIDKVDKYVIRHGRREARNNIRPLLSDTLNRIQGAGHLYEMDEVETDYYLVSRLDRNQVIGRAIFYAILDVYSKSIVGISVGFDNNSWAGASMALYNMVEDKVEYCKKYEIDILCEEWPMQNVIPQTIRMDNGAEYTSEKYINIVKELGIGTSHVPAATGSLKPNIEQSFRQFNCKVNGKLPGQIYKEYGSNHKEKAILDIEQFTKIVIKFVIYFNARYMKDYPINKKMKENCLEPTPINLWNYSAKQDGCMRTINSMNEYIYALLTEDTATITREGIRFKGVLYLIDDMEWLKKEMSKAALEGIRRRKFNVRYDKRTTNYIYFIKDEVITRAYLNNDKSVNQIYSDLTWYEVDEYKKEKKIMVRGKRHLELERAINFNLDVQKIVEKAKDERPIYTRNKTNKVRENRKNEKYQLDKENAIGIEIEYIKEEVNAQNTATTNINDSSEEVTSTVDLLNFYKKKRVEEYYND